MNDGIKWDYKTQHIPCLAHIINLVVQQFLKTIVKDAGDPADSADDDASYSNGFPPFGDAFAEDPFYPASFGVILDKIRSTGKSIRGSSFRWEQFEQACKSYDIEPMTIPLSMVVRWNTAFRMLLYAVYLRRPIHRYIDDCIAKTKPETLKQK